VLTQGFKIYVHCRYIKNQIRVKSSKSCINGDCMRKHYDFSKARKNPYAARLKKSITIRLDEDAIAFFKSMAEETGIPYQSLINLYLKDCAVNRKKLSLTWRTPSPKDAA